jgi:hypothetical protein
MSDNQPELLRITRMPRKTIPYIYRRGIVRNAEVGPGVVGASGVSNS